MPLRPDSSPLASGQLETVWLDAVRFVQNQSWDPFGPPIEYSVNYDLESEPHRARDAGWTSTLRLNSSIEWSGADGEEVQKPFDLDVTIGALFAWEVEPPDERTGMSWVEYNAVGLLWPYLRNYMAGITGMGSLPQLVIYTITPQLPEMFEDEDESRAGDSAADRSARG